ncbi:hypothetical protein K8T06_12280 [bacterium]|nr:hypothetical protein [bacterium]
MAKRSGKDNSGVSMLALIRQVLIDGKVHTAKQIAEHMREYMFKGMPSDRILINVKNLLDHHRQVEKTPKGYRLKGGSNLNDMVRELIEEALLPLSESEIIKLVAKKQDVPTDMIRLDLEGEAKVSSVTYKSRKYYYLTGRKNITEKVYKILKNRNKPLTVEEIYEELESNKKIKRAKVIFLPRGDTRIVKSAGKYLLKVKKAPKKAPAKPRHLVTRKEMDKVVLFLQNNLESYTAAELAREVLDRSLEESNLRFKLARDQRLKRDNDRFYFEMMAEVKEVPVKVTERIEKEFYKVKARMMGSTEIRTVNKLLDRVYGVNMSHQEIGFYQKELECHLLNDEDTILLLDKGWMLQSNDPRANWIAPAEYSPVSLPDPLSPLQDEKITDQEWKFLDFAQDSTLTGTEKTIVIHVSPIDRWNGIIKVREYIGKGLPSRPYAYEILLLVPGKDVAYESFLLQKEGLIRGLEQVFSDEMPLEGGIVILTPDDDNLYKFNCSFEKTQEPIILTSQRINQLQEKITNTGRNLAELIRQLFESNDNKFLSCYQIWAEINFIRQASRRDILATLKDYNCFLPIKSMDGFYSFDKSAGSGRLSVVPEAEKPVQTPAAKVEKSAKPVAEQETVKTPIEKVSVEVSSQEKKEKPKKSKSKSKKEATKKRRRDVEDTVVELPEHLRKLKGFEQKLPKLRLVRPERVVRQVQPTTVRRTNRIGPVSSGKSRRMAPGFHRKTAPTVEIKLELLEIPPVTDGTKSWESSSFVNPDKRQGYSDLYTTLEILKTFVSREPLVRRSDGSIVIFLDGNDLAVYFRVPPENQDCWLAWIPSSSLRSVKGADSWLTFSGKKAKKSDDGHWWATGKFKGPKGNYRDNNVLEGVEIVGKLIELMDKEKK